MAMAFEAPEDLSSGDSNRLSEPGTYHLIITNVREGEGPNGKPCDGFTFEADVLAGTTEGCHGKTVKETIFAPNFKSSDDAQKMSRKKLAAFFIASDAMTPDQLGKSVNIELSEAVGKQIVAEFDRQMEKDAQGKYTVPTKYIQISYANIYHVDDPDVKDVPKHKEALKMRDAANKHEASYFSFKAKSKPATKREPALATASANQFDAGLDDI